MKRRGEHGAIMLETLMILPVLLMLIFYLLQLVFVLLAKEMTYYAAYCGARAAMVYNPADYEGEGGGVVGEAACSALAWISQSVEGSTPLKIPVTNGEYDIPRSENIRNQVTVSIDETLPDPAGDKTANRESPNEAPMVTVTVNFRCPLLIPVGGRIIAGFARNPLKNDSRAKDTVSQFGDVIRQGAETEDERGWFYNYLNIQETCSLGKPYNTATFPRVPDDDAHILRGTR